MTQGPTLTTAALSLGALVSLLWPQQVTASQALTQRYGCVACHQPDARILGPSWKEISQKYGESKGSTEELAASIKAGGSGKWGAMPIPMPPQAQVPDTDLKSIAQWLLDGAR